MINSILLGKVIYYGLSSSDYIQGHCTDKGKLKVYPLVANSNTTYPYIVFKKDNIISEQNKDGISRDIVRYTIAIMDINYNTCCDLANEVRHLFEHQKIIYDDIIITNNHLVSIDENWSNDAFVQQLHFECSIS